MEIAFVVEYETHVVKIDIPKLDFFWRSEIRGVIEKKLTSRPELYGKPLRQSLKEYRTLRVGDYRVVFRIERRIVKVFVIEHRSVVYDAALKRLK